MKNNVKEIKDLVINVEDDSIDGTHAYVTVYKNETVIDCPFYCRSNSTGGQLDTTALVEIRIPADRKSRIRGTVTYPKFQGYIRSETQFLEQDTDADTAYHTVTRYPLKQLSAQLGLNYHTMKKEVVW